MWHWPLPGVVWSKWEIGHHGAFGTRRKHDIHTGVDIYCSIGQNVEAVEDGVVVNIEHFTGPNAGSPWWNDTYAVLVEGTSGVILYGELSPNVKIGDKITEGDLIGQTMQVIKNWKTDRILPKTMLHIELHKPETKACVWWPLNESQPEHLLDPTESLVVSIARENTLRNVWEANCTNKISQAWELADYFTRKEFSKYLI